MGPLIAVAIAALVGFVLLAIWRGRMVSIALAGSECPDCRVPLVKVPDGPSGPRPRPADEATPSGTEIPSTWEVYACPECDRVVTTVGKLPSPLAECPTCHQRSLVVYAERADGLVVVDEWCDLCGRRGRTTLEGPPRGHPLGDRESAAGKGRVLPFKRG